MTTLLDTLRAYIYVVRAYVFYLYVRYLSSRTLNAINDAVSWFGKFDAATRQRVWTNMHHPVTRRAMEIMLQGKFTLWVAAALAKFDDLTLPRHDARDKDRAWCLEHFKEMSEALLDKEARLSPVGLDMLWILYAATNEVRYANRVKQVAEIKLPENDDGITDLGVWLTVKSAEWSWQSHERMGRFEAHVPPKVLASVNRL